MTVNYWLSYPAAYKKQVKALLHQQMWLFGRDILHPRGNLLYDYQFTHKRCEDRGSSMYVRWQDTQQIALWGWGIWFGRADTGAIYVNRYKAKPKYSATTTLNDTIYREKSLPRNSYRVTCVQEAQTTQRLWADLLTWLSKYEAWIQETAGNSWRQTSLSAFSHVVTGPESAALLSNQWQELADQSETVSIKSRALKSKIRKNQNE